MKWRRRTRRWRWPRRRAVPGRPHGGRVSWPSRRSSAHVNGWRRRGAYEQLWVVSSTATWGRPWTAGWRKPRSVSRGTYSTGTVRSDGRPSSLTRSGGWRFAALSGTEPRPGTKSGSAQTRHDRLTKRAYVKRGSSRALRSRGTWEQSSSSRCQCDVSNAARRTGAARARPASPSTKLEDRQPHDHQQANLSPESRPISVPLQRAGDPQRDWAVSGHPCAGLLAGGRAGQRAQRAAAVAPSGLGARTSA